MSRADAKAVRVCGLIAAVAIGSASCSLFITEEQPPDPCESSQWAHQAGGDGRENGRAVATDEDCNVYVCGAFEKALKMGPDGQLHNNSGGADAYLARFDGTGNLDWSVTFGGSMDESCNGIAVDGAAVVVTGSFFESFEAMGPETSISFVPQSSSGSDMYVASFAADTGEPDWVRTFGVDGSEAIRGIAAGGGNIAIVGSAFGGDFGNGQALEDSQARRGFAALLGADGNTIWARSVLDLTSDLFSVALTDDNGVIAAGSVQSGGVFTDGSCSGEGLAEAGGTNAVVARFSGSDGACEWAELIPTEVFGVARSVDIIPGSGDVVAGGEARGPVVPDAYQGLVCDGSDCVDATGGDFGAGAAFVALWATNGAPRKVSFYGGGASDSISNIAVDPLTDRIAVVGNFRCDADFGGPETLDANRDGTCPGGAVDKQDIVVALYSPDGDHLRSEQFGVVGSDENGSAIEFVGQNIVVRGDYDEPFTLGVDLGATVGDSRDMFTVAIPAE